MTTLQLSSSAAREMCAIKPIVVLTLRTAEDIAPRTSQLMGYMVQAIRIDSPDLERFVKWLHSPSTISRSHP